jgi:hypothetical protein
VTVYCVFRWFHLDVASANARKFRLLDVLCGPGAQANVDVGPTDSSVRTRQRPKLRLGLLPFASGIAEAIP